MEFVNQSLWSSPKHNPSYIHPSHTKWQTCYIPNIVVFFLIPLEKHSNTDTNAYIHAHKGDFTFPIEHITFLFGAPIKASFGCACIHLNPHVLERWIHMHPNKA
jgi:hypothetical protein